MSLPTCRNMSVTFPPKKFTPRVNSEPNFWQFYHARRLHQALGEHIPAKIRNRLSRFFRKIPQFGTAFSPLSWHHCEFMTTIIQLPLKFPPPLCIVLSPIVFYCIFCPKYAAGYLLFLEKIQHNKYHRLLRIPSMISYHSQVIPPPA